MYSPPEEEAPTRVPHTSFCAKIAARLAAASAAVAGLVEGVLAEATEEDSLQRHKVCCVPINPGMHYRHDC